MARWWDVQARGRATRRWGAVRRRLGVEGLEPRRLLAVAIAEFPVPTAGGGPLEIAAGPDGNLWFTEGATDQIGQATKTTTTTQLVSSANPSTFGQAVTFTATVAPALGAGTPIGTVTFTFDGQWQAPVPLAVVNGADQATLTLRSLPAGAHTIAAYYDGYLGFTVSTAPPLTQTVNA